MKELRDKPLIEVRKFSSRLPLGAGSGLMITPLIDVLFLLLIFIIMGSSLLQVPGFEVEPPVVAEPRYDTADKLVIMMRKRTENSESEAGSSDIFFNTEVIADFQVLETKLKNYKRTKSASSRYPVIILRADKRVPMSDLTAIMDICRRQQMSLFIITEGRKAVVSP